MANTKISALSSLAQASVVPASDVLPIVNASTTKKITVDALVNSQLAQSATTTGIGVTSPVLRFAVERDNGSGYVASFRNASGSPYITIQTTGGITQLQGINSAFTNIADIGLQPSGGDVKLGGNITQGVAAKGINFTANTPAAGMTSQLLNWYEEGTWTPTDSSGAGLTFTYTAAEMRYTRVGRNVFVQGKITYPSTASTATALIGGLPFTSSASNRAGLCLGYNNFTANYGLLVSAGSSLVELFTVGSGGAQPTNANLSTFTFAFSGTYSV